MEPSLDELVAREARFAAIRRALDDTSPSEMAAYIAETESWDSGTATSGCAQ